MLAVRAVSPLNIRGESAMRRIKFERYKACRKTWYFGRSTFSVHGDTTLERSRPSLPTGLSRPAVGDFFGCLPRRKKASLHPGVGRADGSFKNRRSDGIRSTHGGRVRCGPFRVRYIRCQRHEYSTCSVRGPAQSTIVTFWTICSLGLGKSEYSTEAHASSSLRLCLWQKRCRGFPICDVEACSAGLRAESTNLRTRLRISRWKRKTPDRHL